MRTRRDSRLLRLALVVCAVAGVLVASPARAVPAPEGYAHSHGWFPAHDGIQLHADVWLPDDRREGEKHPVLLISTPYTGTVRFPELFDHPAWRKGRWAYVQVDVRGFGGSEGCFGYYLPDEAKDVRTGVEWAAGQPWSTGKVGMWGKSYDAAQQVLALASKPRGLAATVIQAPGLSGYTALWMNGVHYDLPGRYLTTVVYTGDDATPPLTEENASDPNFLRATAAAATASPTCRSDAVVQMNVQSERNSAFWMGKEPYRGAHGSTVPVFWSHGFWDANTRPAHLDIWSSLRGPKQAWFGQYTHLRGQEAGVGREGFLDESVRFLDRYVRGVRSPVKDPVITVQEGNGNGRWRTEKAWPPADAASWTMPVREGSYTDAPGNTGDGPNAGQGHWTVTAPLPYDAHLAGEARLDVSVTTQAPKAQVIAHVYDIDPEGTATLVTRGSFATLQHGALPVSYALYPQDWRFAKGHRIGVHLSGADDSWWQPPVTNTTVTVEAGSLTMPLLRLARDRFVAGDESDGIATDSPFAVAPETLEEATVQTSPPPKQQRR